MDDIYFRLVCLGVGLLIGWMAGVIHCTRNYAREARREAHECRRQLNVLKNKVENLHG